MCLQIQKSILTRHFFDPFFCRAWVEPNHTGPLAKEKERQLQVIVEPLNRKLCAEEEIGDSSEVCMRCRATIAQLETEIADEGAAEAEFIAEMKSMLRVV